MLTAVKMFTTVKLGAPSGNAFNEPPTENDRAEILNMLNSGKFYDRISPPDEFQELIEGLNWRCRDETGSLICHTVARYTEEELSHLGWRRVPGYLILNQIDLESAKRDVNVVPGRNGLAFVPVTQAPTYLEHHSVIADGEGRFIECLPDGWYPLKKYAFIPHDSAIKGYRLVAS
ncbi:MAG: hypothetical protein WBB28_21735 [Crinalium sp.]